MKDKIKFFFVDKGNIAAALGLAFVMTMITIYGVFSTIWWIIFPLFLVWFIAIFVQSNRDYNKVKKLKDQGYNV